MPRFYFSNGKIDIPKDRLRWFGFLLHAGSIGPQVTQDNVFTQRVHSAPHRVFLARLFRLLSALTRSPNKGLRLSKTQPSPATGKVTVRPAPRRALRRWPAQATVTAPITSSMAAERTSRAGSLACRDSTDTTGTKAGNPSSVNAKRPSLALWQP
jgi:hypothetical protein